MRGTELLRGHPLRYFHKNKHFSDSIGQMVRYYAKIVENTL